MKFSYWVVSLRLSSKAEVTSGDVLPNVPRDMWPPIVPRHQFQSLPPPSVAGDTAVMAESYDASAEVETIWYIGFSTEVEDIVS